MKKQRQRKTLKVFKSDVIIKLPIGQKAFFNGTGRSVIVLSSEIGKRLGRTYHARRDASGTTVWRLK